MFCSVILQYTFFILAHCRLSIAPLNAYLCAVSENNKKTIQFTLDMVAPLAQSKPFSIAVSNATKMYTGKDISLQGKDISLHVMDIC